jgi:thiol-disulfide isomerase/thioredoxin
MNYHKITILIVVFCFTTKFLQAQTVKSIIKQIEKTQKSYKAYELRYDSYFKFFTKNDTQFYNFHQKNKHTKAGLEIGWEFKSTPNDTIINAYDANEILNKFSKYKEYYATQLNKSPKNFAKKKTGLIYLPLKFELDPKKYKIVEANDNYFVLKEEHSLIEKNLDIKVESKTILYVNKNTFFIDTFIQWFWMTGQVQYNKLILKSIHQLSDNNLKVLYKEVDSLKRQLRTYINGDSLDEANEKVLKPLLVKGDSVPNFKAKIYATNDSFFFSVPKDSIVLLDFFYTSCGPCIAAIPHLKEIDSLYKNKGVALMGVNPMKDDYPKLERFVKYHNIDYPILLVENDVASEYFGIFAYPTLLIIKNNQVVFIQEGYSKDLKTILTKELNKLINN